MRLALAILLAGGCIQPPADPPPDPGPGSGWTGPQGDPVSGCTLDSECGSKVCARDGQCYPAASIHAVHTAWTVRGAVASPASCTDHPQLEISFHGTSGEWFGFAPVPCKAGAFTVDKISTLYTEVELGSDGTSFGTTATIDRTTGEARIDLP